MQKSMFSHVSVPDHRLVKGPALVWKRLAAFFIDILILEIAVIYPFKTVIESAVPKIGLSETYTFLEQNPQASGLIYTAAILMAAVIFIYFTALEAKTGQSVGKMVMGIYVESLDGSPKFWQVLVRNIWIIPVFPFVILWVVDPLYMLFTKDNRRLSERLSMTRTIDHYRV